MLRIAHCEAMLAIGAFEERKSENSTRMEHIVRVRSTRKDNMRLVWSSFLKLVSRKEAPKGPNTIQFCEAEPPLQQNEH